MENALLDNLLDADLEFDDEEERAVIYKHLERVLAIGKSMGAYNAYSLVLTSPTITTYQNEVFTNLALQEKDKLEKWGVKFVEKEVKTDG